MPLEWKEPATWGGGNPRTSYAPLIVELKANPGKWALLVTSANPMAAANTASYIKKKFGVEAVRRGCEVYARWVEREAGK
jgi:hypothetical protein